MRTINPLQLFKERSSYQRVNISESEIKLQEERSSNRDPQANRVRIAVPKVGGGSDTDFEDSPVDLAEIGRAYYSDSYINRAVNKIVGLMFKSGWGLSSTNGEALDYVHTRLRLMAEATEISTDELLRESGQNYVLYGNSPIVKTRGQENLEDVEAEGYLGNDPITGLFAAPPERLQIQRDENGNITAYQILTEDGSEVEVSPEEMILMTYHKPSGRAFGIPHISTVIDDVLILRQIEENVARLVYRNIFPLMAYRVGIPEAGKEATDEEIDEVQTMIQNMPLDGMLVLPERHDINTVSQGNAAIQAYDYLRYFRQRVFTGLGVSESVMGIGDSSNRSTADNQSSDLIDLVKEFQQNFASEFQKVIDELLFEGGYDPTLVKEDRVEFNFTEIEQAAKIARENHELQMFMQNGITLDEFRENIGADPVEGLDRFYINLFKKDNSDSGAVDNRDRPANQYGQPDAPPSDSLSDSVSHLSRKNQNSGLTENHQMVTVNLDNAEKTSFAEMEMYWNSIKGQVDSDELTPLLEKCPLPFTSKEAKETFVQKVKQSIESRQNRSADSFVSYEHVLWSFYAQSNKGKEERDV